MNEKTNVNGKDILNTTLTRDYVCAKCGGRLVEWRRPEGWRVECPKGCEAPFVTSHAADSAVSRKLEQDGIAVEPGHKPTKDERRRLLDGLGLLEGETA